MSMDVGPSRIIVTGGGTGGHLYPAIAVIEALKTEYSDLEVLYIGNAHRMEATVIPALPERNLSFIGINFSGLPQGLRLLPWLCQLVWLTFSLFSTLKNFKPDVVFATGGYVTAPVLLAAILLRIPYVLHEPDAHAGKVTRLFSGRAAHITCGFEAARAQLDSSLVTITGNPLRKGLVQSELTRENAFKQFSAMYGVDFSPERKTLLVMGGSLGAEKINTCVLNALPELAATLGLQVIHQVGSKHYEAYTEALNKRPISRSDYIALPYLDDMALVYACADIVLSRAGALSLAEIYASALPSILVPYPYAAADHQALNALASEKAGASRMIEDTELTSERLLIVLREWVLHPEKLEEMSLAAKSLAKPNATHDITAILKVFF